MHPHDQIIMRSLAGRIIDLEQGNQGLQQENARLKMLLEAAQSRIAELEKAPDDPASE